MLSRRQAIMAASKRSLLPAEYMQCDYLQSTASQFIDTGYALQNEKAELYVKYETVNKIGGKGLIGSTNINDGEWFILYYSSYSGISNYVGSVSTWIYQPVYIDDSPGIINEVIMRRNEDDTTIFFNGVLTKTQPNSGTIINNVNIGLFTNIIGNNETTTTIARIGYFKIFKAHIKDNGVLVRSFIPCLRSSDLKPGMYDTVSKQFLVNQGTGEFLFGPLKLPLGLTQSGDPFIYNGHGCVDVINNNTGGIFIYDLVTKSLTPYQM